MYWQILTDPTEKFRGKDIEEWGRQVRLERTWS